MFKKYRSEAEIANICKEIFKKGRKEEARKMEEIKDANNLRFRGVFGGHSFWITFKSHWQIELRLHDSNTGRDDCFYGDDNWHKVFNKILNLR